MKLWYVGCGHNIHSSSDLAIDLIINISTTGIYLLIVHAYSTNIIFTNQLIRCWVRWFMLYSPLYASLAAIRSRAMQCKTSNISNRIYSATCAMCIIQLDNHMRLAFTIYTFFFETRSTSVHIFFFHSSFHFGWQQIYEGKRDTANWIFRFYFFIYSTFFFNLNSYYSDC